MLRRLVRQFRDHEDARFASVSVSVGTATLVPNPATSPTLLFSYADKALYQAKAEGKNQLKDYRLDHPESDLG